MGHSTKRIPEAKRIEVKQLLAKGIITRDIANKVGVSDTTVDRIRASMNSEKPVKVFTCKVCGEELKTKQSYGGHILKHKYGKIAVNPCLPSQPQIPKNDVSADEIASALLKRVVHAINNDDLQFAQIKEARSQIAKLEQKLDAVTQERDRVLKSHNELVLESKRHQVELPEVSELMRIAKVRPE